MYVSSYLNLYVYLSIHLFIYYEAGTILQAFYMD